MIHKEVMSKLEYMVREQFSGCTVELEKEYDLLDENVHGEIDCGVFDLYSQVAYLFEAKSRDKDHARKKAYSQTHKDVKYAIQEYAPQVILFKRYYVYGNNGNIRIEHLGEKK